MKCKFEKMEHQISNDGGETWQTTEIIKGDIIEYDSQDCEDSYMERWIPNGYICEENNKYHREVLQYSTNNGLTWYYYYPMVARKGEFIAYDEKFCDNKWNGHYWVDKEKDPIKIVKCDGNTELTRDDVYYADVHIVSLRDRIFHFDLFDGIIGDCVTSIGHSAFWNCTSLSSVTIPNSVTSIGNQSFFGCTNLQSINIPSGVTSIGKAAFTRCESLTSIEIPSDVTEIGTAAFASCSGLTSITVNATTPPTLGYNVFIGTSNCPIYVPDESVDAYKAAWSEYADRIQNPTPPTPPIPPSCYKARLVLDDSSIVDIPCDNNNLFVTREEISAYSSSLVSAEIGGGVIGIGEMAFNNCHSLSSVTIPNNVIIIDMAAFWACYNLEDITLHEDIVYIGDSAFERCRSLTNIDIPNDVIEIAPSTFMDCSALTSCNIGSGVTSIGRNAFYNCFGLTSINLPSSLKDIGRDAFYRCGSLTSLTIPDSVRSIGLRNTFNFCSGITSVTIGSGVTILPQSAFEDCRSLTSVTIPSGITDIGYYAFENCTSLESITVLPKEPPRLYWGAFEDTNDCPIYVPHESVYVYRTATEWKKYRNRIQPIY